MLADTFSQVTALVRISAWPLVVLVVLIFYHRGLSTFLAALGGRVSRVSFGGASLEFAVASEAPSTVVSAVTEFIDATAAGQVASDAGPSLQTAIYSTGADFVKINLGSGRAWLTSRLFIFAVIFSETASVKKIVFVQESDAGVETFAGVAAPLAVANRLASRFRWLSYALADAERPFMNEQSLDTLRPIRPFTDPQWAAQVSQTYLAHQLIRAEPFAAVDAKAIEEFSYNEDPATAPLGALPVPYIPPPGNQLPNISGLAPAVGPRSGGTSVSITGHGFGGLKEVRFGDSPAAISSVMDGEIVAFSPPGNGKVRVRVVTSAGSSAPADDWVAVRSSSGSLHAEHAAWIQDGQHLRSLIGDAVSTGYVQETSQTKRRDLREQILRKEEDFVVIVDQGKQFRRLIDRRAIIERLASDAAESSS